MVISLNIIVNGIKKEFKEPISLENIIKDTPNSFFAAKVDNRLRELTYSIDRDCNIEYLSLSDVDACRIYETTLRYVALMALNNLYPKAKARFNYWMSRSISLRVSNLDFLVSAKFVNDLNDEIKKIIQKNYRIERQTDVIENIVKYYNDMGYTDKAKILKYRTNKNVNTYKCDNYQNYMFGYMLPSTGYLSSYNLFLYHPMMILQYPRAEFKGEIPKFVDAPRFGKTLLKAEKWTHTCGCESIANINKITENNGVVDLINMCESRHSRMITEVGQQIKDDIHNIKIIGIAGPSSSGKTTFCNRLRVELLSRGIHPVTISIDDYYLGITDAPLDAEGKPDLEHIEALDIDLFDRDMLALIQGEEVTLPRFDFHHGKRLKGKKIKLKEDMPIIIEGIHALNDRLTKSVPRGQKFKIFMAPQQQISIDDHNPIRMTDIRFLRRIVRDNMYRNTDVRKTMSMWASVRRGEFSWIYDNQEDSNFVFNSELTYELCVMKKYALPVLEKIGNTEEHFITANRLIKFLKYFKDIDDKYVPCNSLLREFIGGSCFYDR